MKFSSLSVLCVWASLLLIGCGTKSERLAQGWSQGVQVAESIEGLGGGVSLHTWGEAVLVWQVQRDGSPRYTLLGQGHISWSGVSLTNQSSQHSWAYPMVEKDNRSVFFLDTCYTEGDCVHLSILRTRMSTRGTLEIESQRQWQAKQQAFWVDTPPNIHLNDPGKRGSVDIGPGILNGSEVCVPYCLRASEITQRGKTLIVDGSKGPFDNGIFHSDNLGTAWQIEKIAAFQGFGPAVCKTKAYYYYFVARMIADRGFQLWFSRKSTDNGLWVAPAVLTTTFANAFGHYTAVTESEAIHVCWMDRRNEKTRFTLNHPNRQNWEIAYCHRKDSDTDWSKSVILSKGLLYSYFPSMSVEENRIVVVWSGVRTARDWHSFNDPNDIYYVTSSDSGKTWTEPFTVTDGAKDGLTSGKPQVAIRDGIIHLFYTQGRMNLKQESPGLTKLNQPPWPIYYTQRPFPK